MTTHTEDDLRRKQVLQHTDREDDSAREIRELRDQIEQAVVCVNTALYVLLKNVERSMRL